jgi:general secretion pathway protein J
VKDGQAAAGIRLCREPTDAGFTLVELLAAIALLSLLSVILLGSLRFGLLAWERGAAHRDRVERIALVQNVLRRAIEDAYPLFVTGAAARGRVELEGTAHALALLSPAARALGKGGRARWSLAVARDGKRADLSITATPELAGDPSLTATKVLLPGIDGLELAYFGKARSERAPGWHRQWRDEMELPRLVRIQVSFPPGDPRAWPELVVAPRIGADVGCVYDPLTRQCRGR